MSETRRGGEGRAALTAVAQARAAEAVRLAARGFPHPQACALMGISERTLYRLPGRKPGQQPRR